MTHTQTHRHAKFQRKGGGYLFFLALLFGAKIMGALYIWHFLGYVQDFFFLFFFFFFTDTLNTSIG